MKKPWKVISNADGVDNDFATLAEALKEADEIVALWRDQAHDEGEWDEDVEGVEVHLVTHAARITMRGGDDEDDGVEYGMTEMLGNELDVELASLQAEHDRLSAANANLRAANGKMRAALEMVIDLYAGQIQNDGKYGVLDIARQALKEAE